MVLETVFDMSASKADRLDAIREHLSNNTDDFLRHVQSFNDQWSESDLEFITNDDDLLEEMGYGYLLLREKHLPFVDTLPEDIRNQLAAIAADGSSSPDPYGAYFKASIGATAFKTYDFLADYDSPLPNGEHRTTKLYDNKVFAHYGKVAGIIMGPQYFERAITSDDPETIASNVAFTLFTMGELSTSLGLLAESPPGTGPASKATAFLYLAGSIMSLGTSISSAVDSEAGNEIENTLSAITATTWTAGSTLLVLQSFASIASAVKVVGAAAGPLGVAANALFAVGSLIAGGGAIASVFQNSDATVEQKVAVIADTIIQITPLSLIGLNIGAIVEAVQVGKFAQKIRTLEEFEAYDDDGLSYLGDTYAGNLMVRQAVINATPVVNIFWSIFGGIIEEALRDGERDKIIREYGSVENFIAEGLEARNRHSAYSQLDDVQKFLEESDYDEFVTLRTFHANDLYDHGIKYADYIRGAEDLDQFLTYQNRFTGRSKEVITDNANVSNGDIIINLSTSASKQYVAIQEGLAALTGTLNSFGDGKNRLITTYKDDINQTVRNIKTGAINIVDGNTSTYLDLANVAQTGNISVNLGGGDDALALGTASEVLVDGGAGFDRVSYADLRKVSGDTDREGLVISNGAPGQLYVDKNGTFEFNAWEVNQQTVQNGKTTNVIDVIEFDTVAQLVRSTDKLSNVEHIVASIYDDRIYGQHIADVFSGHDGNDQISGLGGNDTLIGGSGSDTLKGGAGNDVFLQHVKHESDTIEGGAGFDVIDYSQFESLRGIVVNLKEGFIRKINGAGVVEYGVDDTVSLVEGIIGTSTADWITGDEESNYLGGAGGVDFILGRGGDDTLIGGSGSDTLKGGAGNDVFLQHVKHESDTIEGGAGFDVIDYSQFESLRGIVVNLKEGFIRKINGAGVVEYGVDDTVSLVEGIIGTSTADWITGDEESNYLGGAGGVDFILGRGGDDTLIGGAGSDTLKGGAGDDLFLQHVSNERDTIDGGDGFDIIDYGQFGEPVARAGAGQPLHALWADLQQGYVYTATGVADTVRQIEGVIGTSIQDRIAGSDDGNYLDGGGGNDTLLGRGGDDTLIGGTGMDSIEGGAGDDLFLQHVSNERDTIDGGDGFDIIDYSSSLPVIDLTAALRGTAVVTSSSKHPGTENDEALDGIVASDSFSHTGNGADEWLQIDLGDAYSLSSVTITNRVTTSQVASRLNGAEVSVLDANGTVLHTFDPITGATSGSRHEYDLSAVSDARYIRISHSNQFIHVSEVQVLGPVEGNALTLVPITQPDIDLTAALRGTAVVTSSSKHPGTENDEALDGIVASDSFSHTGNGADEWLQIDLGDEYSLSSVVVTNRVAGYWTAIRLNGAEVSVLDANGIVLHTFDPITGAASGSKHEYDLSTLSDARYIRINHNNQFIHVSEVQVFGALIEDTGNWPGIYADLQADQIRKAPNLGLEDTIDNVEGVVGSSFYDALAGDDEGNYLGGNGGNDWIYGRGGDDTLIGGAGSDTLKGGAGDDLFLQHVSNERDTIDGGDGFDIIDYGQFGEPVARAGAGQPLHALWADLQQGYVYTATGVADTVRQIEGVIGTSIQDRIAGSDDGNYLDGGGGNDTLLGRGGDDTLIGGTGMDSIEGGAGDDLFLQHVSNERDTIDGGDGFDIIDYSQFESSTGISVNFGFRAVSQITRSSSGVSHERIAEVSQVEGAVGTSTYDSFTGNDEANFFDGAGGDDILRGHGGDDVLSGGSGNDTIYSGAGDDLIEGGEGSDAFVFRFDDEFRDNGVKVIRDFSLEDEIVFEIDGVAEGSEVAPMVRHNSEDGTELADTIITYDSDLVVILKDFTFEPNVFV